MLTGKKKLLVLSVLTAITSVDFVCNANAEELKSYKLSEIIVEGRITPILLMMDRLFVLVAM